MPMPKDKITAKEFFERVPETNELCELIEGSNPSFSARKAP